MRATTDGYPGDGARAGQAPRRERRLEDIRQYLLRNGSATIDELVSLTDVSRMTIHRDLDVLSHRGQLHRTRGGASVERTLLFESNIEYRLSQARAAKQAIARTAADLIEPGQVILLDDSTTSHALLLQLSPDLPVTIATNSLPSLTVASSRPNTQLIALGGDYQPNYQAFFGLVTESALASIHADVLVASASALRGRRLFHQSQFVISARRAMLASSERSLLLVDSSKIGATALYGYGDVEDYDLLITDDGAPQGAVEGLADLDVTLVVARVDRGDERHHPSTD